MDGRPRRHRPRLSPLDRAFWVTLSRLWLIIAVTADSFEGDRERCLAVGMDDYLAKPFKRDDLAAVIERWLIERVASEPERT